MSSCPAKLEKKFAKIKEDDNIDPEFIEIQEFKMKKIIKQLESVRGEGTSLVTLYIKPGGDVSQARKKLIEELGTASNIKSRVNRLSVESAIVSVEKHLVSYIKSSLPNGLVIFSGENVDNKKKLLISFEPFRPINISFYKCDSRFHCDALHSLMSHEEKLGFIILDGNGCMFATLSGTTKNILHQFSVDLPKKHGRGGQSSARFGRIRVEKRELYLKKVIENANNLFWDKTKEKATVTGLIIGGCAEFKDQLNRSDLLDPRLHRIVWKVVVTSYGGDNGLNQAIHESRQYLSEYKITKEKKIIAEYFNVIAKDSGISRESNFCFGTKDVFKALEMGAISDLIVWEELPIVRYVLLEKGTTNNNNNNKKKTTLEHKDKDKENEKRTIIKYVDPENKSAFEKLLTSVDENGLEITLEIMESISLVDWMMENYKNYGTKLHLISDATTEGSQFCKGFGGFGGITRYGVDFSDSDSDPNNKNDPDENDCDNVNKDEDDDLFI